MIHPVYCTCAKCTRSRLAQFLLPNPDTKGPQTRQERTQTYLESVCNTLDMSVPLLIFTDHLQNAGACGEAGHSTIWLQTEAVETLPWRKLKEVVLHELAHIAVDNTPGMGEVEAHGREFSAALRSIKSHPGIRTRLGFLDRIISVICLPLRS